ncbi:MAG: hypothetical protein WAM30_02715 [Candidatus Dormiibacterota bacterium]
MSAAWGHLVVRELPGAYVVAPEAAPDDWICRFDRSAGFPARDWAENMARAYNARLAAAGPDGDRAAEDVPAG